ncbi:very short patch repair endonuclease [Aerophototrophica crusticola]|uniref:Very short patch repair endonuclease n=1 Tax=Aerophototrophica crusticola TaxID=1709002 RepID=A0A858R735_9PROT|nr:very short patch repair endonuclease [Rhodospirillaceae bacterium B3]
MGDIMTVEARSRLMSKIRGKDTKPEWKVRRLLHALGYRYRLHVRGLPGTPDLVFPARRAVVFINGCFWHWHAPCRRKPLSALPPFWQEKLARNQRRVPEVAAKLQDKGWRSLSVFECELKDMEAVEAKLRDFLGPPGPIASIRSKPDASF